MTNTRYLFVSECLYCDKCQGAFTQNCPRYAYWDTFTSLDDYHYTGVEEMQIRERTKANPNGTADAACRAADGRRDRVEDDSNFNYWFDENGKQRFHRFW